MTIEKMPPPILVTGCPRSGTSMIAGAIGLCGAFGGALAGPNRHNGKGMFENIAIRDKITRPYLRELGADPNGQYPLPDVHQLPIPKNWNQRVGELVHSEGYEGGNWFIKCTKMSLIWPVWHYAFPNSKWIIVRRRTGDIINSCLKTSFMKAFHNPKFQEAVGVNNEPDGWKWYVRQFEERFVEMIMEGVNCKVVWPHRMVDGDYQEMMETIDWLGLKWNSEVLSFIDPKLWKARRK